MKFQTMVIFLALNVHAQPVPALEETGFHPIFNAQNLKGWDCDPMSEASVDAGMAMRLLLIDARQSLGPLLAEALAGAFAQPPIVIEIAGGRAAVELLRASAFAAAVSCITPALAQAPAAGQKIRRGTAVRINVSKGSATTSVPSEVGTAAATAQQDLASKGFKPSVVQVPSDQPTGTVVAQSPSGGQARKGASVQLNVSNGPAATTTTTTPATTPTTPTNTTTTTTGGTTTTTP